MKLKSFLQFLDLDFNLFILKSITYKVFLKMELATLLEGAGYLFSKFRVRFQKKIFYGVFSVESWIMKCYLCTLSVQEHVDSLFKV